MATYIALIHGEAGAYGIAFPDLPGCTSGGATIDEALAHVREAAADWVEAMVAQGNEIPAPRTFDALRADAEFADDFEELVLVATVDLDVPGRALRINITLDEALLARIDRAATDAGESRSGWLATAARLRLRGGALVESLANAPKVKKVSEVANDSAAKIRKSARLIRIRPPQAADPKMKARR